MLRENSKLINQKVLFEDLLCDKKKLPWEVNTVEYIWDIFYRIVWMGSNAVYVYKCGTYSPKDSAFFS